MGVGSSHPAPSFPLRKEIPAQGGSLLVSVCLVWMVLATCFCWPTYPSCPGRSYMLFDGMMALAGAAVVDHARSTRRQTKGSGPGLVPLRTRPRSWGEGGVRGLPPLPCKVSVGSSPRARGAPGVYSGLSGLWGGGGFSLSNSLCWRLFARRTSAILDQATRLLVDAISSEGLTCMAHDGLVSDTWQLPIGESPVFVRDLAAVQHVQLLQLSQHDAAVPLDVADGVVGHVELHHLRHTPAAVGMGALDEGDQGHRRKKKGLRVGGGGHRSPFSRPPPPSELT